MSKLGINDKIKLNSGYEIPQLGFGVRNTRVNRRSRASHNEPPSYQRFIATNAFLTSVCRSTKRKTLWPFRLQLASYDSDITPVPPIK